MYTEGNANSVKEIMSTPNVIGGAEQALFARFSRPARSADIVYEFTRDPAYLHQYYRLREKMFVHVWGLKEFEGQEDEIDRQSHILIARIGNQVVAGGRLTVSSPRKQIMLPLEDENFRTINLFPELNLSQKKYAEFSRVAVEEGFQDGQCTSGLFKHVHRKIVASKVDYLFGIAPVPVARIYRKAYKMLGMEPTIRRDIAVPEREGHEGIKMNILVMPVQSVDSSDRNLAVQLHPAEVVDHG